MRINILQVKLKHLSNIQMVNLEYKYEGKKGAQKMGKIVVVIVVVVAAIAAVISKMKK